MKEKLFKFLFVIFSFLAIISCTPGNDSATNEADLTAASITTALNHNQIMRECQEAVSAFILGQESAPEITFNGEVQENLASFLSKMKTLISENDFYLISMTLNDAVIDPEMTFEIPIDLQEYTSGISVYGKVAAIKNADLSLSVTPRVMLFDPSGANASVRIVGEYALNGNVEVLMRDNRVYKVTLNSFDGIFKLNADVTMIEFLRALLPTDGTAIIENLSIDESSRIYLPNGNSDVDITIEEVGENSTGPSQINWNTVIDNMTGSFEEAPEIDFSSIKIIPYITAFHSSRLTTTLNSAIADENHENTKYGTLSLTWPVTSEDGRIKMDYTLTDYQYSLKTNWEEMPYLLPELANAFNGAPSSFGPKEITGTGSVIFIGKSDDNGILDASSYVLTQAGTTLLMGEESANYEIVSTGSFKTPTTVNLNAGENFISSNASCFDTALPEKVIFNGKELDAASVSWIIEDF